MIDARSMTTSDIVETIEYLALELKRRAPLATVGVDVATEPDRTAFIEVRGPADGPREYLEVEPVRALPEPCRLPLVLLDPDEPCRACGRLAREHRTYAPTGRKEAARA